MSRMKKPKNEGYVPVPCEAWFDPESGRLVVGIFLDEAVAHPNSVNTGVDDAHKEVKTSKISVVDHKGSSAYQIGRWPYSDGD